MSAHFREIIILSFLLMRLAILNVSLKDAVRVWQDDFRVYRQKWKTEIVAAMIEPLFSFFALAFGVGALIGTLANGVSYATFISAGILSFNVLTTVFNELSYNAYERMVYDEKYAEYIADGVGAESVAFGDLLWGVSKSMVQCVFVLAVVLIFRGTTSVYAPLAVLPLAIGSLLVGALTLGVTARTNNPDNIKFMGSVFYSSIILCGLWFPIDLFPAWLQTLSNIIPMTGVIDLARSTFTYKFSIFSLYELIYISLLAIIFTEFAIRSVKVRFANPKALDQ